MQILYKYYGNKVRYGNKILCECYVCRKVKLKVQFKYLNSQRSTVHKDI